MYPYFVLTAVYRNLAQHRSWTDKLPNNVITKNNTPLTNPVCRLLPAFVNRSFPTTHTPRSPIALDATQNRFTALPIHFGLMIARNTSD